MERHTECSRISNCHVSLLHHELMTPLGVANMAASLLDEFHERFEALVARSATDTHVAGECRQALDELSELRTLLQVSLGSASTLMRLYTPPRSKDVVQPRVTLSRRVQLRGCFERATRLPLFGGGDAAEMVCELSVPDDVMVQTDEVAWYQVFANLINNSRRHGYPQGGQRTVSIQARIEADQRLIVCYSDNGVGLNEKVRSSLETELADLTDLMTQARPDRDAGLGLRVVQDVVRHRLGGDVKFPTPTGEHPGFAAIMDVPVTVLG